MNDLISRSALLEELHKGTIIPGDMYSEGIMAGVDYAIKKIEAAPAVDAGPKWISVEDGLPEKSGDYLAFTEKGIFMVLSYSEIHRAFNAYDWCENITPIRCTHWMPLPEVEEHD